MIERAILKEIRSLRLDMTKILGTRLDKEAMANRLGVTRRTLYNRIQSGSVPNPGTDGKWLLADVMVWEEKQTKQTKEIA